MSSRATPIAKTTTFIHRSYTMKNDDFGKHEVLHTAWIYSHNYNDVMGGHHVVKAMDDNHPVKKAINDAIDALQRRSIK